MALVIGKMRYMTIVSKMTKEYQTTRLVFVFLSKWKFDHSEWYRNTHTNDAILFDGLIPSPTVNEFSFFLLFLFLSLIKRRSISVHTIGRDLLVYAEKDDEHEYINPAYTQFVSFVAHRNWCCVDRKIIYLRIFIIIFIEFRQIPKNIHAHPSARTHSRTLHHNTSKNGNERFLNY